MSRGAWVAAGLAALSAQGARGISRLRIVNGCPMETIWIAHEAAADIGPDSQNVEIKSHEHHDFETPDNLMATRYWPKMGCDKRGTNCGLGASGGPGEACVKTSASGEVDYSQCAPPVDTKFEGSFGTNGAPCNPETPGGVDMAGCDYIDVSLVDGWTLPFKLEIHGGECKATSNGVDTKVESIDCSKLLFEDCPASEELSAAGFTADLRAINPKTGKVAGCYSPCMLLQDEKWNNSRPANFERNDDHVAPYCCPTPPETPEACRAGPITSTNFLKTVHKKCPGVYGYAYDDGTGLMRCESSTHYTLTLYCPAALPPDLQKIEEEKKRKEEGRKKKAEAERKRKEQEEREKEERRRKKEEEKRKEEEETRKREGEQDHRVTEVIAQDAASTDAKGFCCFHAKSRRDVCGTCHPMGKALPTSYCARSRAHCEDCGGTGRWCGVGAQGEGSSKNTTAVIGRSQSIESTAPGIPLLGGVGSLASWLVCAALLAASMLPVMAAARAVRCHGSAYQRALVKEDAADTPA